MSVPGFKARKSLYHCSILEHITWLWFYGKLSNPTAFCFKGIKHLFITKENQNNSWLDLKLPELISHFILKLIKWFTKLKKIKVISKPKIVFVNRCSIVACFITSLSIFCHRLIFYTTISMDISKMYCRVRLGLTFHTISALRRRRRWTLLFKFIVV